MIFIKKNQSNKLILSLTESSRLTNPYYLFVFENEFNLNVEPIYWTTDDTSNHPNRYNEFELNENTSGSTTGGISTDLSLISGQYKYVVYESEEQTLDVLETTQRIIESGRMVVEIDYTTTQTNNINNFYE